MRNFNLNNESKKIHSYAINDIKKFRYVISVVNFINVGFVLLHMEVRILN